MVEKRNSRVTDFVMKDCLFADRQIGLPSECGESLSEQIEREPPRLVANIGVVDCGEPIRIIHLKIFPQSGSMKNLI